MQTAQQARNETGQKIFENSKARRGGGAYCQLGEMEHVTEESSGAGEAMSRYDAGREILERKTRSSEGHGGRQDQVAEESNRKVL